MSRRNSYYDITYNDYLYDNYGITRKDINIMDKYIIDPIKKDEGITIELEPDFYGELNYDINDYRKGAIKIKKIVDLIGTTLESFAYDEEPERYTALVKRGLDDYIITIDPVKRREFVYNTLSKSNKMKTLPLNAIHQIANYNTYIKKTGGKTLKRKTHRNRHKTSHTLRNRSYRK